MFIPPNLSTEFSTFIDLKDSDSTVHFATWVSSDDKMVVDLFTRTETDEFAELCVRYNGIEIVIYTTTPEEFRAYIDSLEEVIYQVGSPRYNEMKGL